MHYIRRQKLRVIIDANGEIEALTAGSVVVTPGSPTGQTILFAVCEGTGFEPLDARVLRQTLGSAATSGSRHLQRVRSTTSVAN
jgi:hypothetical protein